MTIILKTLDNKNVFATKKVNNRFACRYGISYISNCVFTWTTRNIFGLEIIYVIHNDFRGISICTLL